MKNREKNVALIATGIMLGTVIVGPAAQAAEMLTAQWSPQKICVDGKPVQIEAYSINGNNYAKIRDLGKAVDFNVSYDAATNTVQIDSTAPYQDETPAQASRTVTLPTDGNKYVPQVGDSILCDDGTLYEIKDVTRWDTNVFQDGPVGPLPTPTCDWSAFPTPELQPPIVKHYHDEHGDDLFVRNVYEVRRMVYTIYNAIGEEPDAWRDGKPLATVQLTTPAEYEAYTAKFWPWRGSDLVNLVHSCPNSRYYIDAWDYYHNGIFHIQGTVCCHCDEGGTHDGKHDLMALPRRAAPERARLPGGLPRRDPAGLVQRGRGVAQEDARRARERTPAGAHQHPR